MSIIAKIKKFLFEKVNRDPFQGANMTEEYKKKYYSNIEQHPYRRTFKYLWQEKYLFIPFFIMNITYTVINIIPPFFGQLAISITSGQSVPFLENLLNKLPDVDNIKSFVENTISGSIVDIALQFGLIIVIGVLYVFGRTSIDYIKSFIGTFLGQNLSLRISSDMLKSMLHTDLPYFKQESEGTLLSRLGECGSISGFLTGTLISLVNVPLTVILTLVVLFAMNFKLTLICLIAAPGIALSITYLSKIIGNKAVEQKRLSEKISTGRQENIRGIEVVKIFSTEDREVEKYRKHSRELIKFSRKLTIITSLNRPFTELVMISAMLIILAYGGYLVFKGEMPFDFLWGFLLYMLNISQPVNALSGVFVGLKTSKPLLQRAWAIIDLPPEKVDDDSKKKISGIEKSICFKDVYFSYPRRGTETPFELGPVNINIKRGDVVAFVGNSGGGKSTLVNLIPKLIKANSGNITFDDVDIDDLNTRSVRQSIGVVAQENILFYGTVRDNIVYGKTDATDEDIEAATKIAHAKEFIDKLPQGLDTDIGARGVMLSGGQRQRIALARAVLRRPAILILDEATSALDTESEMHVQNALNEIIHMQTTFVIAHRLSTIKNANMIHVVENGKIIESGSHDDLIKVDGKYKKLYSLQFRQ